MSVLCLRDMRWWMLALCASCLELAACSSASNGPGAAPTGAGGDMKASDAGSASADGGPPGRVEPFVAVAPASTSPR